MYIFLFRAFHYVLMSAYYSLGTFHIRTRYLPNLPTVQELFQEISGMLILHNDVWEYPRAYPRTFINVLGMNLNKDPGPIPEVNKLFLSVTRFNCLLLQDILSFIEGGEHGVMLFALGVSLIPSALPKAQVRAFFDAFRRLPQKVIMRMEKPAEDIEVPQNVLLGSFLPQQAILAHPNVTLYFGHGGVNGLMEAIYYRS